MPAMPASAAATFTTAAPCVRESDTVLRGAGPSAIVRLAQAALTVLLALAAARLLGAAEYGRFALAATLSTLLAVPVGLGLPTLAVREVAGRAHGDPGRLRALARTGPWLIIGAGAALTATTALALAVAPAGLPAPRDAPLLLGAVALAGPWALLRWAGGWLQGLGRAVWAQAGDGLLRPLLALAGLGLCAGAGLDGPAAFAVLAGAVLGALGIVARQVHRAGRLWPSDAPARPDTVGWLGVGLPLMAAGTLSMLQLTADVAMLGALADSSAAGVYHVASRLAQLAALLLVAANVVVAPRAAQLHRAGDRAGLQRLLTHSARLTTVAALVVLAATLPGGAALLDLFGPGFAAGAPALTVCALAQLANVACGSVAVVLAMTGRQRALLLGVTLGAGVNLVLNALLIPACGMLGAALATLASTAVWNGVLAWQVRRSLGVDPTVLGRVPEAPR